MLKGLLKKFYNKIRSRNCQDLLSNSCQDLFDSISQHTDKNYSRTIQDLDRFRSKPVIEEIVNYISQAYRTLLRFFPDPSKKK